MRYTNKTSVIGKNFYYHMKINTFEFAQKLNVPWYKARMIETGEIIPSDEIKQKIANELNCTVADLYTEYGFIRKKSPTRSRRSIHDKFELAV